MGKTIVMALGGNALGDNLAEQMAAVKSTSRSIVDLIEQGHRVVVTHGNGPQVGMIDTAFEAAAMTEAHTPHLPMSVCVALSQGYIGYDLQNALREELLDRGLQVPVASLITQVIVDEHDPAFKDPTKPIGSHFSKSRSRSHDAQRLRHEGRRRPRLAPRGGLAQAAGRGGKGNRACHGAGGATGHCGGRRRHPGGTGRATT